jgi:hypothetical protein
MPSASGRMAALNAQGRATLADPRADDIRRILRTRHALVSVEDAIETAKTEAAPTALAA